MIIATGGCGVIDYSEVAGDLGWQPSISFKDGIRQTDQRYLALADWVASVTSCSYSQWAETHYNVRRGSARAEA